MAKKTKYKTIKGKLGVFGWVSRIMLIAWTIAMIAWLVGAGHVASDARTIGEEAGAAIGIGLIIGLWVAGTVIFGIWALLTRPPKTLVPIEEGD